MKKLHTPKDEAELAVLRSLFDAEGVRYFVHNDHFGTLKVGPPIDLFNAKTILVADEDYPVAAEILEDYLQRTEPDAAGEDRAYSTADKIRMVFEALVFHWYIPGRKWPKKKARKSKRSGKEASKISFQDR